MPLKRCESGNGEEPSLWGGTLLQREGGRGRDPEAVRRETSSQITRTRKGKKKKKKKKSITVESNKNTSNCNIRENDNGSWFLTLRVKLGD